MKTILYNPIFINPQAYYVFPRLTRWLRPDDSYKEPANYIGQIEVTIIAYGEIGYTEYFEHTNYIDFTNFSNSYVRISLFTRLGSCVLGEWKIGAMEGDRPYIEPEVLASLKAVVIVGDKTNQDKDRDIVANLVDASNPFIISNAAFKLNSGFGKYEITFQYFPYTENITTVSDSKVVFGIGGQLLIPYPAMTENIPSFKIKVSGLSGTYHFRYYYRSSDGVQHSIDMAQDGYYELPICYNVQSSSDGTNCGFANNGNDVVTITQIPSFEGAFVTDGIDDLITSTKTVQEMLGGSNEITVVSMVHQVKDSANNVSFTNYIRGSANGYFRNIVNNYDKTGIYGYTSSDLKGLSVVNNILGDKNDYTANGDNRDSIINGNFSVQGYSYNDGNNTGDFSSVAWYWTIIANKVLTTDQINQVIAYFNLDRTLKSDIYCNIAKQGITNENHAEFGDKLIDFSGNGRDIQLNNIAWKGDSGIGKYETELSNTSIWTQSKETTSSPFSSSYNGLSGWIIFANTELTNSVDMPSFKIQVKGLLEGQELIYRYYDSNGQSNVYSITKDGDYTLPSDFRTAKPQISNTSGFQVVKNEANIITITQIPSHAGGLCLDGVNDFGKVTGMPIYKDYTVVTDREIFANTGAISSKNNPGAFVETAGNSVYSFGQATSRLNFISTRSISYLSKYSYCGQSITAGAAEDGTDMWLGTIRDNDTRFFNGAIYSLMSFPYSMSEFLIERQLKKHKLGTLYPDMVEFRPIVNSNVEWNTIEIWQADKTLYRPANGTNETGTYLQKDSTIGIYVKPKDVDEVTKIVVNGTEYTNLKINSNGFYYVTLPVTKSPQKIDITIDEYIRYEDIVQPYPDMIDLKQDNKTITWGDKLKVGSEIIYYNDYNSNPLSKLYNLGTVLYNGNFIYSGNIIEVKKDMVFTSKSKWKLDNNEPKCILSPSRLRIPNSSYKILGYIPDISGHGNHGKINNSAYAGMSGANGYVENFTTWGVNNGAILTDNTIKTNSNFNPVDSWVAYKGANTILNSFSVNITGIPEGGILNFRVNADTFIELSNGRNDLSFDNIPVTVSSGFRITKVGNLDWSNLVIQQIGQYEGAYCLDGVDDFITIPTTVGGKQVLMKVNWQISIGQGMLYDQRGTAFAIWNSDKYNDDETDTIPAYSARNEGNTYIDGILNKNILASQLRNITHNIVATNTMLNGSSVSPTIGCRTEHDAYFTNMSLYDFMLFDEIDSDEEILTLNEYVGIEGNTDDLFN